LFLAFVGPCPALPPHRDRDYRIRTGFTLGEPVSLVKVFRLFRLERIFLVFALPCPALPCPALHRPQPRLSILGAGVLGRHACMHRVGSPDSCPTLLP